MIDIRCSRDGLKCGGCPIIKECEHIELTEEIDAYSLYEKGRKDAIDECKQILLDAIARDGKTKCHEYMVAVNKIEQLKEHKNE